MAAGEDVGPLCGLGVVVKDLFDVAGYSTVAGTPALIDNRPQNSSIIIDRFRAAGGVILVKTRMHELAYGITSINPFFGPVSNPYNTTMHTGGSSGGTAALVAARAAPAGFCSDTGGSCRIPGSMTGTVGFRPSKPNTGACWDAGAGILPLSSTRDTPGIITRSVADVILFNEILSACNTRAAPVEVEGLRLGYPTNFWNDTASETIETFAMAMAALEEAGAELVPFDATMLVTAVNTLAPDIALYSMEMGRELSRYFWSHQQNISFYEVARQIVSPILHSTVQTNIIQKDLDAYPSHQDYINLFQTYRPMLQELYDAMYDQNDVDVIVIPSTVLPSRPIGSTEPYTLYNGRFLNARDLYRKAGYVEAIVGKSPA
eukprot:jgi/Astpho2/681/Aster-x0031